MKAILYIYVNLKFQLLLGNLIHKHLVNVDLRSIFSQVNQYENQLFKSKLMYFVEKRNFFLHGCCERNQNI